MSQTNRRDFLQQSGIGLAGAAAVSWSASARAAGANERLRVGLIGCGGRGRYDAGVFAARHDAEIAYVADPHQHRLAEAAKQFDTARPTDDFRRLLDDKSVDAVINATPVHWHAPATILACQAGKHVYVEKPCSHTAAEGEWAVQAARKNNRVVQMGAQRRTWPAIVEAIEKLHSGAIGKTLYARTWYNNRRGPIGIGKNTAVPDWLDWDLWQGPAPRRPYKDNVVHYNWHWHWHWGNGELGNNGVHGIDVARWGLDVKYPLRVTAGGGKYRHDDDQETPDTMMVTMDFPEGKTITWEGLSWSPLGVHDSGFGVSIHGTEGTMVIRGSGYAVFDMQRKEIETKSGGGGDADHFQDFLDAIRNGGRPNADIEIAHRSTLLCHLGNIAYRTGSTLHTDPANGHIIDNPDAEALWSREYEQGWEPKV